MEQSYRFVGPLPQFLRIFPRATVGRVAGEFVQFLRVAQGSLKELKTHVLLCQRVGLSSADNSQLVLEKCEGLSKMLRALIRSLQSKGKG